MWQLWMSVSGFLAAGSGVGYHFLQKMAFNLCLNGLKEKPTPSEVAIVLGAYTDGYKPSPPLIRRLHAALHLYRFGIVHSFIVSGGQGENETISEARSMKRFLVLNGVPANIIFEERLSSDTWENLRNSDALMKRLGMKTAVIVTSDYHLPRALAVARQLNMQTSGYAARSAKVEQRFAIRELFARVQYEVKGQA